MKSVVSWCGSWFRIKPFVAYSGSFGIVEVMRLVALMRPINCTAERNYGNGRYRIRTYDLTGVIRPVAKSATICSKRTNLSCRIVSLLLERHYNLFKSTTVYGSLPQHLLLVKFFLAFCPNTVQTDRHGSKTHTAKAENRWGVLCRQDIHPRRKEDIHQLRAR